MLVISDPEIIKQVTVKDFHIFPNRRNLGDFGNMDKVFGKFVSTMTGEDWKRVRTILTPTFTSGKMRKMFRIMNTCVDDAIDALKKTDEKTEVDLKQFFGKYSLDVIARCCFATKTDVYNNPDDKFMKYVALMFKPRMLFVLAFVALPRFMTRILMKLGLEIIPAEIMEFFNSAIRHLIKERVEHGSKVNDFLQLLIDAQEVTGNDKTAIKELIREVADEDDELEDHEAHHGNENEEESAEKNNQIFDKSKLKKKTLDEVEVIAQSILFLVAGYETTATLLTYAFYQISLCPEIQNKLLMEVRQASKDGSEITYSTIASLPYLDAFIQETLRFYPPVLLFDRNCEEDYKLPNTEITVPKGTTVAIPTYAVHHDSDNYPNPESFEPTRFLAENRDKIKPYTYLPFGAGPRNCVGMRFALLEAKLLIARILMDVEFRQSPKTDVPPVFLAKGSGFLTCNPLLVNVRPRT